MKIKLDFVTNSSSVCFCAWGIYIKSKDITDKIKKLLYEEVVSKQEENDISLDDYLKKSNEDILEDLDFYFEYKRKISTATNPDNDGILMVGLKASNIDLEISLKDQLNKLQEIFRDIGIDNKNIHFIEESWTDN